MPKKCNYVTLSLQMQPQKRYNKIIKFKARSFWLLPKDRFFA